MAQSLARNLIHLNFSTKNRAPLLQATIRPELNGYIAGIFTNWKSPAIIIGSVADHVHALFGLSKNYALVKVVEEVKRGSSKWIKTKGREFAPFARQNGNGAFSVSSSMVNPVCLALSGRGLAWGPVNPGRCPGLSCLALSGRPFAWGPDQP
jgi:REP element-mobilizing transposase RayT